MTFTVRPTWWERADTGRKLRHNYCGAGEVSARSGARLAVRGCSRSSGSLIWINPTLSHLLWGRAVWRGEAVLLCATSLHAGGRSARPCSPCAVPGPGPSGQKVRSGRALHEGADPALCLAELKPRTLAVAFFLLICSLLSPTLLCAGCGSVAAQPAAGRASSAKSLS